MRAVFGAKFEDLGNALPIGRQSDGHSCGICVVNAVEHAIFGAPLFIDRNRYNLRTRYFVEAVKYLAREGLEGEREGCVVEVQDEEVKVTEPQDPISEAAPQSPTPSPLFGDTPYPPSPDTGSEMMGVDDPAAASGDEGICLATSSVVGTNRLAEQQGKRVRGSDDESSSGCKSSRKRPKGKVMESDDESGEDCVPSRSAEASRKLKESLKSGTFVVDKGKRERFERKCRGLDGHAEFHYKESWQVRHSKCSKWVTMREPYELFRFGEHIKGCKKMQEKGRNGTINSFFKRQDTKETGTMKMAKPSARKQIVIGARAKPRETLIPSIPFTSEERPCLGLGKDQDKRIDTYISRIITEGAGSRSDTHITKMLFGNEIKYSELDDVAKRYVAAAQVHMQKWKISHTLGAIFSTDCKGKVIVTDMTQSSACNQCLGLLKLDVFKKALGVQPPPLKNLKFIPHRHRNAATNLGINLAKIEGFSNLLEKVSYCNHP